MDAVRDESCPTCGGTGPDVFETSGDDGPGCEVRCGDEWHDDRETS